MTTCSQKIAFTSEKNAKKECKYLWRNHFRRRYYYKCNTCGNYHLTKLNPRTFSIREHTRDIEVKYLGETS